MALDGLDESEIIREFLKESLGSLETFHATLKGLQDRTPDKESLVSLRRSVHTISGTSGFLGFMGLSRLARSGEGVLQSVQSGALSYDPTVYQTLQVLGDSLNQSLLQISKTGKEGPVEDALLDRLQKLAPGPDGQTTPL